nr:putative ribonuclease H-like domain-containing protein [Tanacetum cinerariifolium]
MQNVWILVDLPYEKRAIGTKWVYRNKKDERGIVIRNKARLIAQGHTQEEGIDYKEVFAPVARIEAIRLFLAYASFMVFLVYQMDVKSVFLYGTIEEEVYVCHPPGFEDPENLDKVYKVVKALYELHHAPRAWYETLATYLLENRFQRGTIDQTLFIKKQQKDILLVQIYVDDIIFGATNKALCQLFKKLIKDKFQMSSMGELTLFLGLRVKQKKDGIFISQDKYVAEILKKFRLSKGKSASTPIDAEKPLLKDSDGKETVSTQQYVLLPLWSTGSKDPQNIDVDVAFDIKKIESEVHVSPSSSDKTKKHDEQTKEKLKARVICQNAFLYGTVEEEVYASQPLGFKDPDYPDKVYKVVKALYGLHQAPRAWYETLANYLLENGFQRGKIDQTLFIKKQKGDILLVQVYVNDIIFGSTNKELCKAFEKLIKDKFQMSSMGELTFFLGLQVKKKDNGIFISQDKYVAKILRKFGLTYSKSASSPIDTEKPLLKDPD